MPITAQGGAGGVGAYENGGAGGVAGQPGQVSSNGNDTGGPAGAAPGGNGGTGTANLADGGGGGGGGADGSTASPTGGAGGAGGAAVSDTGTVNSSGGGGGGGGGNGQIVTQTSTVNGSTSQGGAGGVGGAGGAGAVNHSSGGGGGGGDGGNGAVLDGTSLTFTNAAAGQILAGAGGNGGSGSTAVAGSPSTNGGNGGAGGDGGDGFNAGAGNVVVNNGLIRGGAAGQGGASGGTGGIAGGIGVAGAGVVGSNLTLTNAGVISGGFDSSGISHVDAIDFTVGSNILILSAGGTVGSINGNVRVSGSLDIQSGGMADSLSGGLLVFGTASTTVTIESGVTLKDDVSGFGVGNTLDFRAVTYSNKLEAVFTAAATGGTLRVFNIANPSVVLAQATLLGTYTSGVFGLSNDGAGGTKVGFTATPALGMQAGDIATSSIPGSAALVVVDRYNADYSLYQEDTITKAANGNFTFHFQNGSFFTGKSFAAFDNVTNSSGLLLSQTLYNSAGRTTQQTQFNANGSVYLQDNVVYPAAGQVLYQYRSGSFFTGKSFSAFDNLATSAGNTLLDQLLYNRDGTHTFTVPGSNLTLTAVKNDTFNVTGQNETTRFNATGFGKDTFNGYKVGDIFSFSKSIFADYNALSQHVSGTSSAVITTTANDTLMLANVAKSSLTSSMFAFS